MNAMDPFYTGAYPALGALILGIVLICVVGWFVEKWEKK